MFNCCKIQNLNISKCQKYFKTPNFQNTNFQNVKLKVSENWSYVAFVLDRLLLIIFSTSLLIGTLLILSSSSPATREWGEPLTTMRPTKPLSGDTFEFELRGAEQAEVDTILP